MTSTRSYSDLIKGIRAHKRDEDKFIAQAVSEIRTEVKSPKDSTKAEAIRKLTYLYEQGIDCSWAAFHVVEVMSSTRFAFKRAGYLAAAQSFREDTNVALLATNLIKKDLTSTNQYEQGIVMNCLSSIVSVDFARDLLPDIISMLNSTRPFVRKKAAVLLYASLLKYPDGLKQAFRPLVDMLKDEEQNVVCAAAAVICELAMRNPKSILPLAPVLFNLLTGTGNNWLLIKLVKIFAYLTPLEPRMAKKLRAPVLHLLETTPAKSLLYECIVMAVDCMARDKVVITACIERARLLVEDADRNLRCLGLECLSRLAVLQPKVVASHRDMVVKCLRDADITTRLKGLEVVMSTVTRKNLEDTVEGLFEQVRSEEQALARSDAEGSSVTEGVASAFKKEVVTQILEACRANGYKIVRDFAWLVSTITRFAETCAGLAGHLIADIMLDVAVRVPGVREKAVSAAVPLLGNTELSDDAAGGDSAAARVLEAASFLAGEYSSVVDDPLKVINWLLGNPALPAFSNRLVARYVQAALKLFISCVRDESLAGDMADELEKLLKPLCSSRDVDVQERACEFRELIAVYDEIGDNPERAASFMEAMVSEELRPVAPKAQRKDMQVPVPEGLDLEEWIVGTEKQMAAVDEEDDNESVPDDPSRGSFGPIAMISPVGAARSPPTSDSESSASSVGGGELDGFDAPEKRRKEEKKRVNKKKGPSPDRHANDPFYLPVSRPAAASLEPDAEEIPIVELKPEDVGGRKLMLVEDTPPRHAERRRRKEKESERVQIITSADMPDGAAESSEEEVGPSRGGGLADELARIDLLEDRETSPPAEEQEPSKERRRHRHKKKHHREAEQEAEEKEKPREHRHHHHRSRKHRSKKEPSTSERVEDKFDVDLLG